MKLLCSLLLLVSIASHASALDLLANFKSWGATAKGLGEVVYVGDGFEIISSVSYLTKTGPWVRLPEGRISLLPAVVDGNFDITVKTMKIANADDAGFVLYALKKELVKFDQVVTVTTSSVVDGEVSATLRLAPAYLNSPQDSVIATGAILDAMRRFFKIGE